MTEKIADGIWRIGVPLPENPLRELNSYFIPGGDRDILIDTGFCREECREALMAGIRDAGGRPEKIDVLLTHLHSDHSGLAAEAASDDGRIFISGEDMKRMEGDFREESARLRRVQFLEAGFPEAILDQTQKVNPAVRYRLEKLDDRFVPVQEGDRIQAGNCELEWVSVPGHTPGNMMLWEKKRGIMFTGDHILFDISPNITSWIGVEDSLGDYLESLRKAGDYPVRLAFRGHRGTGNYGRRIDELLIHHRRRLEEVLRILNENPGLTVYELAGRMRWRIRAASWEEFPAAQKWFAVGECMAHTDYLEKRGYLRRHMEAGVFRLFPLADSLSDAETGEKRREVNPT